MTCDQPKDMSKEVTENGQIQADFEGRALQGMIEKDNSRVSPKFMTQGNGSITETRKSGKELI